MPNSPYLWVAAVTLWILDASLNVTMEPFRAFVGDMLPNEQRTRGFAMQAVFIGAGAFLASTAPYFLTEVFGVSSEAPAGKIPPSVQISFYIGAVALLAAVLWTVLTTKEYSPEELARFREPPSVFREEHDAETTGVVPAAFFTRWGAIALAVGLAIAWIVQATGADKQLFVLGGGVAFLGLTFLINGYQKRVGKDDNFLGHILGDLVTMPSVMKQLAVVQFFSWVALFLMWIYATPTVALPPVRR